MVKIQVVRNEETKYYKCIVTNDPIDLYFWEIITPRKFTIIRSNRPVFDKQIEVHRYSDINGTKERWLNFYTDREKDMLAYFYPITQKWNFVHMAPTNHPLSDYIIEASEFLQLEIINFALEHDRKEMMLVHLEHLSTKSMFVNDMVQIIARSGVPEKVCQKTNK